MARGSSPAGSLDRRLKSFRGLRSYVDWCRFAGAVADQRSWVAAAKADSAANRSVVFDDDDALSGNGCARATRIRLDRAFSTQAVTFFASHQNR
jgi:hypothetical protein